MKEQGAPLVRVAVLAGICVGGFEAVLAAFCKELPLRGALWLVMMGAGAYGLLAAPLPLALRRKNGASALTATLGTMALAVSAVLVQRRFYATPRPEPLRLCLEILARGTLVLVVCLLVAFVARRIAARPLGARFARATRSWPLTALAIGLPCTAVLAAAVDVARDPLSDLVTTVGPEPSNAAPAGAPSIVLVLIDTLRADRLGAYGSPHEVTPFLDRLSRQSTLFSENLSLASWTKSETASLLTSLPPAAHGAGPESAMLADDVLTLPEVLTSDGYLTLGFSTNGVVSPAFGMTQGFAEFRNIATTRPRIQAFYGLDGIRFLAGVVGIPIYLSSAYGATADVAVNAVGRRLAQGLSRSPVFLYVHVMDPHSPYLAPPGHGLRHRTLNYIGRRDRVEEAYREEVRFTDREVERLRRQLLHDPAFAHCLFAVTSDHGEEFYEHGHISHGYTLYEEMVRVPLILDLPGESPRVVTHRVEGIDLAPGLLARAGLPVPPQFQGRDPIADPSTEPMLQQEDFDGVHVRALRDGGFKLIWKQGSRGSRLELFDLDADPQEQRNLAPERPALASSMLKRQKALESQEASSAPVSPEAKEILHGLGYLE